MCIKGQYRKHSVCSPDLSTAQIVFLNLSTDGASQIANIDYKIPSFLINVTFSFFRKMCGADLMTRLSMK